VVAYRAGLDALADVGLVREHGESREAFARRVTAAAPAIDGLTAAHLRAKLARTPETPRDRTLARQARRVASQARGRTGFLRAALGLANPISFLRVR
jgi:hypothetical protein